MIQTYFSPPAMAGESVRSRNLKSSLRRYLGPTRGQAFAVSDLADTDAPLGRVRSLAALRKARYPDTAIFVGLTNDPSRMLGSNVLVLTRSVGDELTDFAARNRFDAAGDPDFGRQVLAAFDLAIVLDRSVFGDCVGFAPWLPLTLSDRFPVTVPGTGDLTRPPRILVLDHDGAVPTAPLTQRKAILVGQHTPAAQIVDDALSADIHLHLGFSNHGPTVALSPFDSLANGAYTIVVPSTLPGSGGIGRALQREMETRSYADVRLTLTDALDLMDRMLDRITAIRAQKFVVNPEVARLAAQNERYLAACYKRFDEVLPK